MQYHYKYAFFEILKILKSDISIHLNSKKVSKWVEYWIKLLILILILVYSILMSNSTHTHTHLLDFTE